MFSLQLYSNAAPASRPKAGWRRGPEGAEAGASWVSEKLDSYIRMKCSKSRAYFKNLKYTLHGVFCAHVHHFL